MADSVCVVTTIFSAVSLLILTSMAVDKLQALKQELDIAANCKCQENTRGRPVNADEKHSNRFTLPLEHDIIFPFR